MSSHTISSPVSRHALRSVANAVRSEYAIAIGALGVVGLHVADDNFIQPNAGTSAADHLVSGLLPLALFVGAAVIYPRVRAGLRSVIALLGGFFGVLGASRPCTTAARSDCPETTTRGLRRSRPVSC